MTAFRGIGAGCFIIARIVSIDGDYYLLEISGVLPPQKKTDAYRFAVAKIIQNPELVDYIHANFSDLGKVDKILSVSGYPDPQYEVRFENGEVHTFMQPKKTNNPTPNQPDNSSLTVEEIATKMVEDMARNKIDVNGEPIVQSMENQKVLTKNKLA